MSFILKCIAKIEKRPTASELLADPFLDKSLQKPGPPVKVGRCT